MSLPTSPFPNTNLPPSHHNSPPVVQRNYVHDIISNANEAGGEIDNLNESAAIPTTRSSGANITSANSPSAGASNTTKVTNSLAATHMAHSILSRQDLSIPLAYKHTKYQHSFSQEKLHYTTSCVVREDLRYSFLESVRAILLWSNWSFSGQIRDELNLTSHRIRRQRTELFGAHAMISEQEELLQNLHKIETRKRIIPRQWYELIDNAVLRLAGVLLSLFPFVLSCINMFVSWSLSSGYLGLIVYATIQLIAMCLMAVQFVVWIVFLFLIVRNNVHIENQRKVLFLILYAVSFVFATLAFIISFLTLINGASFTIACITTVLTYVSVSFHLLALLHVPHFRQEYFMVVAMHFSDTRTYSDTSESLWYRQTEFQKLQEYALVGCLCGGGIGILWTIAWYLYQLRKYKQHHETYTDRTITVFMDEKHAEELTQKIWSLRDDIQVSAY